MAHEMTRSLQNSQILIVEDSRLDYELIVREIRRCSIESTIHHAEDWPEFQERLAQRSWDLVISDFNLQGFDAFDVLRAVKESSPDTPVILVSGAVGEENAIRVMRSGASDFILKGNLVRLVPAIERELNERALRLQKKRMESALRENEAFCRSIIETAEGGIWILDRDHRVTFANDKLCELMGHDRDELLGRRAEELADREDLESARQALSQLETGERFQTEWRLRRADGSSVYTIASGVPTFDEEGRPKGSFAIFTDITSRKEVENAVAAANQAKSRFLANMSHEIRTPLSVILGFSELALNGEQSESQRQHALKRIKKNAEVLAELVNDVLDLSKIEADKLETETVRFNLHEMLHELVESFEIKAREKNLAFIKRTLADLPVYVETDPLRTRQILTNLISNAIKFTERGQVVLDVRAKERARGEFTLQFAVEDSGIGIEPHQARKLFQPFSQADVSTSRKHGGTGLGLALSKRLAEILGGSLRMESSQAGIGSRFLFEIPARVKEAPLKGSCKSIDSDCIRGLRVLVVDDSVDNRELTRRYLESAGAIVSLAGDGAQGVESARTGDFDCVLMDIQMPGIDGFEAYLRLKRSGYRTPVLALTASALREERERALALGFHDYLTKPVTRAVLVQRLSDCAKSRAEVSDPAMGFDSITNVPYAGQMSSTRFAHGETSLLEGGAGVGATSPGH